MQYILGGTVKSPIASPGRFGTEFAIRIHRKHDPPTQNLNPPLRNVTATKSFLWEDGRFWKDFHNLLEKRQKTEQ
jgi:hypothetical protein